MSLEERLAGIRRLSTPVWIFDFERARIAWANQAAVDFWGAPSSEELLDRDFSDMSEAARTRNQACMEALRQGRVVQDEWTWYPRGVPVTVRCSFSGFELPDGRLAQLCEATVKEGVDPRQIRGVEALRHTSVMVALVTPAGEELMQNPSAQRAFGQGAPLASWFVEAGVAATILREAGEGRIVQTEALVETLAGRRWHAVEARRTLDPATGEPAVLIHQVDMTCRREKDEALERQRQEILSLSAPILEVGREALAVPIIGALDPARVAQISERLLARVVEQRAAAVILDLTGALAIGADDLLALVRALDLLGARPIITGVQPAMAQAMVAAGAALGGALLLRDLRQGIAACVGPERARAPSPGR